MPSSAPELGIAQLNILIIGGTRFQGRYLVNGLLNASHSVTVFHRGSHTIDPCEGLTNMIGDLNTPADLANGTVFQGANSLQDRLPNKGINRGNACERHALDVGDHRLHF